MVWLIVGALLAISLATNVVVILMVAGFKRDIRLHPTLAVRNFFSAATLFHGHTVTITHDGEVNIRCDHNGFCKLKSDE